MNDSSEVAGCLRDWRAPQILKDASEAVGCIKGWRAPQRLGASKA